MLDSRVILDVHPVDEIAKTNPKVDADQVREAQAAIEELRQSGVLGPSYDIMSPYERRPARKAESSDLFRR